MKGWHKAPLHYCRCHRSTCAREGAVAVHEQGADPELHVGTQLEHRRSPLPVPPSSIGPVCFSFSGLFRLVLAYFFSHGTIKSAKISRLLNQPNSPMLILWPPLAASTIIEPDLRVKGPNSSQGNHRLLIQSATLHGIHTYINIHAKEVGGVQVAGASTSLQELFRL